MTRSWTDSTVLFFCAKNMIWFTWTIQSSIPHDDSQGTVQQNVFQEQRQHCDPWKGPPTSIIYWYWYAQLPCVTYPPKLRNDRTKLLKEKNVNTNALFFFSRCCFRKTKSQMRLSFNHFWVSYCNSERSKTRVCRPDTASCGLLGALVLGRFI